MDKVTPGRGAPAAANGHEAHPHDTPDASVSRRERDLEKVRGAILLAAGSRFGITLTNFADARELALELGDEARRSAVVVDLEEREDGSTDLHVHHR
jgi:hypothetical protein